MDKFIEYRSGQLDSPAYHAFSITPDDEEDLTISTRAIYIGVSGDLTCILQGDTEEVTFLSVVEGNIYPLRIKRVLESSTADGLVGLY